MPVRTTYVLIISSKRMIWWTDSCRTGWVRPPLSKSLAHYEYPGQRQNGCLPPENEVSASASQLVDRSHETASGRISTGSIRSLICLPLVVGACSHGKHLQLQHLGPVLSALNRISRGQTLTNSGNLLRNPPVPRVCHRHSHDPNTIQDPSPPDLRPTLPPDHTNRTLTFLNQTNPLGPARPLMALQLRPHRLLLTSS